jgi:hypothetical protein
VLHETADVAPSQGTPPYLSAWFRHGRERLRPDGLAVHNPVIFVTQRPTNVNLHALSEADHVYLFGLRTDADLSTMAGVMQADPRELRPQADRHAFYYRGPDGRVWAMPPLALGQRSEDAIQSVRQAR